MNVFELHPEELLDKAADGTLTEVEQERLDAHLKSCVACQFEPLARNDFREAMALDGEMVARLSTLVPETPPRRTVPSARFAKVRVAALAAAAMVAISAVSVAAWVPVSRVLGLAPLLPAAAAGQPAVARPRRSIQAPTGLPAPSSDAPVVEAPAGAEAEGPSIDEPYPQAPVLGGADFPKSRSNAGPSLTPLPVQTEPRGTTPAVHASTRPSKSAEHLFRDAVRAEREGALSEALTLYRELERGFPGSVEAETARATEGQLLLDHGAASEALRKFDEYLARGGERLREEVLVGRALALEKLHRDAEETQAWSRLLEAFPASPHAVHARTRLATIASR